MTTSETIKDLCGSVNPRTSELTLDEKKRAHELGILEFKNNRYLHAVWRKCSNATGNAWIGWFENPDYAKTMFDLRITPGREHLMDKKESEKTMEEYEHMTADSAENCHKILDWSFSPGVEIKIGAEWFDHFDGVRKGYKYRRKTPAPQKEIEVVG
jgi:hypothetical protein